MGKTRHTHHGIDYIEISVTSMTKAKRFYETAFGWTFNDYGPDYAGIQKDGGEAGGLRAAPQVSTGSPLVILYSNDLDRTLSKVVEAVDRSRRSRSIFPVAVGFTFTTPAGTTGGLVGGVKERTDLGVVSSGFRCVARFGSPG